MRRVCNLRRSADEPRPVQIGAFRVPAPLVWKVERQYYAVEAEAQLMFRSLDQEKTRDTHSAIKLVYPWSN
jgi:hypothetical protein